MPGRFDRLRAFLERMAFAGLKPDVKEAPKKSKLQSLINSAEEIASLGLEPDEKPRPGPATMGQRVLVVCGLLVLAVSLYLLIGFLRKPAQQGETNGPPPVPVQIVPPGLKIEKNKDLEVVEIDFNRTADPKVITGTLRNRTNRGFSRCEISFHVTTKEGTQLGAVDTTVQNVPPWGSVKFRILVPEKDAAFTMVRELHAE
jgi:hypothetical protein